MNTDSVEKLSDSDLTYFVLTKVLGWNENTTNGDFKTHSETNKSSVYTILNAVPMRYGDLIDPVNDLNDAFLVVSLALERFGSVFHWSSYYGHASSLFITTVVVEKDSVKYGGVTYNTSLGRGILQSMLISFYKAKDHGISANPT